jgi:hypothetical protein
MSKDKNIHPEKEDAISFSFWGDSQGGWSTFSVFAQKMAGFDDDFSVGLGDLVADGKPGFRVDFYSEKPLNPLQKKMPSVFYSGQP